MPNRYSRIIQPTVVNPISFEEFARVPMAEAQAQAAGLQATSGISTEFNVDQKDLMDVSAATDAIDQEKNSLIDNILSNGVNNETIGDFIRVKKIRDTKYKTFIDKAQANKQRIDTWRATVDAMVVNRSITPQFGETIKTKEYGKWDKTLGQEGTTADFVPSYGVQYIDVDQDIQSIMRQNVMNLTDEIKEHGLKTSWLAGRLVITDATGRDVSSNYKSLTQAVKILENDYTNPETNRGAFAEYSDMAPQDLSDKINNYMEFYKQEKIDKWGGRRQFMNPLQRKATTTQGGYAPTSKTIPVPIKYKTDIPSSFNRTSAAVVEASNIQDKKMSEKTFWEKVWEASPFGVYGKTKEILESWEEGKLVSDEKNYNLGKIIEQYSSVANHLIKSGKISPNLYKKATKNDIDSQEEVASEIRDYMEDLSERESTQTIFIGDYLNTEFGNKMKNNPKGVARDIGTQLKGVPVYNVLDRDNPITGEDKAVISTALLDGTAVVRGVAVGGSSLTTDSKGDYIEELSQGYIVDIGEDEYIIGRSWEGFEPKYKNEIGYNYQMGVELEKYISTINMGVSAPVILRNKNGERMNAVYYQDPVTAEKEVWVGTPDGNTEIIDFARAFGYLEVPNEVKK